FIYRRTRPLCNDLAGPARRGVLLRAEIASGARPGSNEADGHAPSLVGDLHSGHNPRFRRCGTRRRWRPAGLDFAGTRPNVGRAANQTCLRLPRAADCRSTHRFLRRARSVRGDPQHLHRCPFIRRYHMNEALVLGVVFAVLLIAGVPIAFAIGGAAFLALVVSLDPAAASTVLAQRMATGIDSFALLAIPFFILAGNLMNRGGIATR